MNKASFYAVLSVATLVLTTCATRAPTRPATMKEMPTASRPAPQATAPAAEPKPREPFVNEVVTLSFSLPEKEVLDALGQLIVTKEAPLLTGSEDPPSAEELDFHKAHDASVG